MTILKNNYLPAGNSEKEKSEQMTILNREPLKKNNSEKGNLKMMILERENLEKQKANPTREI